MAFCFFFVTLALLCLITVITASNKSDKTWNNIANKTMNATKNFTGHGRIAARPEDVQLADEGSKQTGYFKRFWLALLGAPILVAVLVAAHHAKKHHQKHKENKQHKKKHKEKKEKKNKKKTKKDVKQKVFDFGSDFSASKSVENVHHGHKAVKHQPKKSQTVGFKKNQSVGSKKAIVKVTTKKSEPRQVSTVKRTVKTGEQKGAKQGDQPTMSAFFAPVVPEKPKTVESDSATMSSYFTPGEGADGKNECEVAESQPREQVQENVQVDQEVPTAVEGEGNSSGSHPSSSSLKRKAEKPQKSEY